MTTELKDRVLALEFTAESHGKSIDLLQKTGDTLKKSLEGVERTLMQIKWLAMGALGAFVGSEFGLLKALKLVFGLG